jgi:hypothetical protein
MHEAKKHVKKAMHTGEIHQSPAGYKKGGHVTHKAHHEHMAKHHAHGGHVAHKVHHHADGGHVHMHEHVAKHHSGGHDKSKAHPMKKGGKACNW